LVEKKEGQYILKEFKEFAMRGNVVDMAVGIIIDNTAQGNTMRILHCGFADNLKRQRLHKIR
jgi:hypothetical protein